MAGMEKANEALMEKMREVRLPSIYCLSKMCLTISCLSTICLPIYCLSTICLSIYCLSTICLMHQSLKMAAMEKANEALMEKMREVRRA